MRAELKFRNGRRAERIYIQDWRDEIGCIIDIYKEMVRYRADGELGKLVVYKSKKYRLNFHRKKGSGKKVYNKIIGWLDEKVERIYNNNPKLHLEWKPHIYVFWNGGKCVYVGRTKRGILGGGGKWNLDNWKEAKRFQVLFIKNQRSLAEAECLARDIWNPYMNAIKPSEPKYSAKCPVHQDILSIKTRLGRLYKA